MPAIHFECMARNAGQLSAVTASIGVRVHHKRPVRLRRLPRKPADSSNQGRSILNRSQPDQRPARVKFQKSSDIVLMLVSQMHGILCVKARSADVPDPV